MRTSEIYCIIFIITWDPIFLFLLYYLPATAKARAGIFSTIGLVSPVLGVPRVCWLSHCVWHRQQSCWRQTRPLGFYRTDPRSSTKPLAILAARKSWVSSAHLAASTFPSNDRNSSDLRSHRLSSPQFLSTFESILRKKKNYLTKLNW